MSSELAYPGGMLPGPPRKLAEREAAFALHVPPGGEVRYGPVTQLVINSVLALAVFLGGFVIFEPAPYELFLAALLGLSVLAGMRVPFQVIPLLLLFTLFNFGGVLSSFVVEDYMSGFIYVAVSFFLALTSVFFASVVAADHFRLKLIFNAYTAAAVVTAMAGIIGYFEWLPGFEVFTRYSRAMGVFQDPNVFAPFLMVPILYLMHGIMNGSPSGIVFRSGVILILLLGVFLAFSRAGWGLLIFCITAYYFLQVATAGDGRTLLKYLALGTFGLVCAALLLLVALQFDAVYTMFEERARAVQEYDAGRIGRFARHAIGFEMALTKPFGIGPLEFGLIFGEDTHNIWLKALLDYGWIGFVSWVSIIIWTLISGLKLLFRQRPWHTYFQIVYVVFVGHVLIGNVIDTDHWRHLYMLIGIMWGCFVLEARWQKGGEALTGQERRPANQPRALSLASRLR